MIARLRHLTLAAAVTIALVAGALVAHADGASCTAHLAGLQTGNKSPVEVVVFNTTAQELTLDLRLLDGDGNELVNRVGGIVVAGRGTAVVGVETELDRDLPKRTKRYSGLVAIELTGGAPFGSTTTVVHATQYFGKRKNPKGAVVFRPLFTGEE